MLFLNNKYKINFILQHFKFSKKYINNHLFKFSIFSTYDVFFSFIFDFNINAFFDFTFFPSSYIPFNHLHFLCNLLNEIFYVSNIIIDISQLISNFDNLIIQEFIENIFYIDTIYFYIPSIPRFLSFPIKYFNLDLINISPSIKYIIINNNLKLNFYNIPEFVTIYK